MMIKIIDHITLKKIKEKATYMNFFWRLEEIWGSRPNVTVVVSTESIATSSDVLPQRVSQAISQATSQVASSMASQPASFEEELFDWSTSPTPQPPQRSSVTPQLPQIELAIQAKYGT